jgi:hypothetical protein
MVFLRVVVHTVLLLVVALRVIPMSHVPYPPNQDTQTHAPVHELNNLVPRLQIHNSDRAMIDQVAPVEVIWHYKLLPDPVASAETALYTVEASVAVEAVVANDHRALTMAVEEVELIWATAMVEEVK